MRFVLCDNDQLYTRMIELMLADLGHEVVGVTSTAHDSVALLAAAQPDVVIVDPHIGINSDFDIVATSNDAGILTIVFSDSTDDAQLSLYDVRPIVVYKPDLTDLERAVRRIGLDSGGPHAAAAERRQRPARASAGRVPTNVADAQAFYEALNEAGPGDVLMSIEVPNSDASMRDMTDTATSVRQIMRDTDRLVASPWAIRVFLPGGEEVGAASLTSRLEQEQALPDEAIVRTIVIGPDESPTSAFDRLKSMGQET